MFRGKKLILTTALFCILTAILTFTTLSICAKPVDTRTQLNDLSKQYGFKIISEVPKDRQAIEYNSIADFEKDLKEAQKGDVMVFTRSMKNKKVFTPKNFITPSRKAVPVTPMVFNKKPTPMRLATTYSRYYLFKPTMGLIRNLEITHLRVGIMTEWSRLTFFDRLTDCCSYLTGYTAIYDWQQKAWTWYLTSGGHGFHANVYATLELYLIIKGLPVNQVYDCAVPINFNWGSGDSGNTPYTSS